MAANARQGLAERDHFVVLGRVADFAPARVIVILLAAAGVFADGLNVAVSQRANPHVGPRRRNNERANTKERLRVANQLIARADITGGGDRCRCHDEEPRIPRAPIQTRLTVNEPGDEYEQEAERAD